MSDTIMIQNKLNSIIDSIKDGLSSDESQELNHYMQHNEFGIAFENVSWFIIEKEIKVQSDIVDLIKELFDLMDGDTDDHWKEIGLKGHIESIKSCSNL